MWFNRLQGVFIRLSQCLVLAGISFPSKSGLCSLILYSAYHCGNPAYPEHREELATHKPAYV